MFFDYRERSLDRSNFVFGCCLLLSNRFFVVFTFWLLFFGSIDFCFQLFPQSWFDHLVFSVLVNWSKNSMNPTFFGVANELFFLLAWVLVKSKTVQQLLDVSCFVSTFSNKRFLILRFWISMSLSVPHSRLVFGFSSKIEWKMEKKFMLQPALKINSKTANYKRTLWMSLNGSFIFQIQSKLANFVLRKKQTKFFFLHRSICIQVKWIKKRRVKSNYIVKLRDNKRKEQNKLNRKMSEKRRE